LLRDVVDNIKLIQDGFLMAQSRQKSYTNQKIHDLEFMIGDRGLIEDFTHKEFDKILREEQDEPKDIGPFVIVECICEVAYELALSPSLSGSAFHI